MSEPWPPAFMRTAPPTDPGTPTAHSRPMRPAATDRRARTGRLTAPPARTAPPSDTSMLAKASPRVITSPRKPESATRRFDPLPSTSTATPLADTASRARARSCSDVASRNKAAAPPTR